MNTYSIYDMCIWIYFIKQNTLTRSNTKVLTVFLRCVGTYNTANGLRRNLDKKSSIKARQPVSHAYKKKAKWLFFFISFNTFDLFATTWVFLRKITFMILVMSNYQGQISNSLEPRYLPTKTELQYQPIWSFEPIQKPALIKYLGSISMPLKFYVVCVSSCRIWRAVFISLV